MNALALLAGSLIFIQNYYSLILMRLFQGMCVGFYSAIANLIVKELSPTEISGTMGTFPQLNVTLGVVFGCFFRYLLSYVFDNDPTSVNTWFILFGFTLITVALQTVVLLFVFPYETPKYLLLKGRNDEARQLVEIIYKRECVNQVLE